MHGRHALPASTGFGLAPLWATSPGRSGAKHARRGRITGRLHRRYLAYRAIQFVSTHIPARSGADAQCLLLVHARQVVGQVHYRTCSTCARGVITTIVIDERFRGSGLGTRALSHLRSRHPGTAWHSTAGMRAARDLLRRMGIPHRPSETPCPHALRPPSAAPHTAV
ncbi:GNAT family N-acetyltransferase [Streptomyces sp. NPDC057116]|uniref:GNAT family N-acetyltransferase n=1 Tax=Streptomyces sp. NPDC057116 TaxID=3346023 RepID=UPI00364056C1